MEKTPKKIAGKKASELITKCDKLEEPVAICDQSKEVVANCNNLNFNIESLIRTIRGQFQYREFNSNNSRSEGDGGFRPIHALWC